MYGNYYGNPNYQPSYYPQTANNYMAMPDTLSQLRSQQPTTPTAQQASNGVVWVQGEAGAKSHLVAPNTTVMLMDSEASVFYLKSADNSGMPLPLRVFEYKEITPNTANIAPTAQQGDFNIDLDNYVTKDELHEILANMTSETAESKAVKKTTKKVKEDNDNA